jgi:tetratricopeptide (TPR) repeat protein
LAESALEEARFAESEGDFEDAAGWVRSALEQLGDDDERVPELRKRSKRLRARAREAEQARAAGGLMGRREEEDEHQGPDPLELEVHFGTLVGTLRDEVADRYLHRGIDFQEAYVDLNQGRLEEARSSLDALADREPDDPVVRLERGRCRLLMDDFTGAREDFEAAWPELGDEPLDQAGVLSVPILWAEACLAQGDAAAVVQGLAGLAGFAEGAAVEDPEIAVLYGRALLEDGADRGTGDESLADARAFLVQAAERFPRRPDLSHMLAQVLDRQGEWERAISVLETAIAPSCATGSCSKPPLHAPSVRTLAGLYLAHGAEHEEAPLERVGELLTLLVREQGGQAMPPDLRLLVRYQRASGLDDEAEETEAMLRRLEAQGTEVREAPVDTTAVLRTSTSRPPI